MSVASEIKLCTLGVRDLDRSEDFYRDAFGFELIAEGTASGPAWEQLWRMPAGMTGSYRVLSQGDCETGRLRIVEFSKDGESAGGQPVWGDGTTTLDLGHYAVNFRARDLRANWPRMIEAGATARSEPTHWFLNEELEVCDSQCYDPDGTLLDVFEIHGSMLEVLGEQTRRASEVQTMAVHSSDAARSQAFYETLGFSQVLYDQRIENLESFFHIPAGTVLHNVNLINPGLRGSKARTTGRIELAHYIGAPGNRLVHRAVPPNLGPLSVSLECDELAGALDVVETAGRRPTVRGSRVTDGWFGSGARRVRVGPRRRSTGAL